MRYNRRNNYNVTINEYSETNYKLTLQQQSQTTNPRSSQKIGHGPE